MSMDEIEKIPPHSLEAEMSFLGCVLIDQDAMLKASDLLQPEDFYKPNHVKIYSAILELYQKNETVDLLTLGTRLEEMGVLEEIGGRSYLVGLTNTVPTASNVVNYASIIHRKAVRRRLIGASAEITRISYLEEEYDVDSLLDKAEQNLFGVSQIHLKQTFTPIRGVLNEAFDRIDEIHKNKGQLRGVPTGFTQLDNKLAGLQKSDLIIVAARPSVGKTSFVLDIIRNVARKGKPVGMFSLEMSKEQLVDRMLCSEANVDLWKMRTGRLSDRPEDDDFPRIGHAIGVLSESPIFIDDSPNINIMQIRTKARRLQTEHGLDLIVIDYLQLMSSSGKGNSDNRVQEVAEITRGLKGLARELNVPVVALSQLSRVVEQSKPAIPKLSHLRESGSIEQDADVVLFIYRKAADRNYRPEDIPPDERGVAEIHIAKHRNGPTGEIKVAFVEHLASFRNLEATRTFTPAANASGSGLPPLKPKSAFASPAPTIHDPSIPSM
jgi:replicative DNA helicase